MRILPKQGKRLVCCAHFILFYLKSSKTHTSAAPLLLEKGAEVKMKLQDLKLLIDKKKNIKILLV